MELGHLKVFGCPAYALVEGAERSKLDPKSRKLIFIGFPPGVKGYLLVDPHSQKTTISRNVIFDERSLLTHPGVADGADRAVQGSSVQPSLSGDVPLDFTSNHVHFEVETCRHVPTHVEDQRRGPSDLEKMQGEPHIADLQDNARGVA